MFSHNKPNTDTGLEFATSNCTPRCKFCYRRLPIYLPVGMITQKVVDGLS